MAAVSKPIPIGKDKQLVFDDLFLERSEGINLRMNAPIQEPGPVLTADKPWEKAVGHYNTVILDQGKLRMWYFCELAGEEAEVRRRKFDWPRGLWHAICYAESTDGVHWEKPNLGRVAFEGSWTNNIVTPSDRDARQPGATVFRDETAPADERYKMWTVYIKYEIQNQGGKDVVKRSRQGLWGMVSPNGLDWRFVEDGEYPLSRGNAIDTHNVCFWDEDISRYIGFVRITKTPKGRQRTCSVGVVTSSDFRKWTWAKEVFRADAVDEAAPVPYGEPEWRPVVDFYTPMGMKVPGVRNAYVLLPTAYYHWDRDAFPSTIDVRLATSRDLHHWWQPAEREPFLRLTKDGTGGAGMIFSNPWMIPMEDELWIYYAGRGWDHRQSPAVRDVSRDGIFRARLRQDGFVSADAGYGGGEFTTPALIFDGKSLELNMDGSAGGWLLVEILSEGGAPISHFRLADCDPVRGNSVRKRVTWNGASDVSSLCGKPVRLRFVMKSTKLFAFQFVE